MIGIESGDPCEFGSIEELFAAFRKQLHHFVDVKVRGNNIIERLYATHMPAPFLSLLIEGLHRKRQGLQRRRSSL